MRSKSCLFALTATAVTALLLVTMSTIFSLPAIADDNKTQKGQERAQCTCPESGGSKKLWTRPKFAELKTGLAQTARLDISDEIAALETLQLALSEVGDGSTYVWHRYHGRLSGVVQPTTSFKTSNGQVCRHLIVVLTSGSRSERKEGIACRLATGQWQLQG
ncbi:MAG: hypothetical protein KDJ45_07120 [Hyphomicrobiaceae bacterium]|nr:hypothetical protein [Hyphomicrobiaceae bacterium]MCC0011078.1 hypothetical protein [Hyphomicrobiaceae bacterium]